MKHEEFGPRIPDCHCQIGRTEIHFTLFEVKTYRQILMPSYTETGLNLLNLTVSDEHEPGLDSVLVGNEIRGKGVAPF